MRGVSKESSLCSKESSCLLSISNIVWTQGALKVRPWCGCVGKLVDEDGDAVRN